MSEKTTAEIKSKDCVTLSVTQVSDGGKIKINYHTLNGNSPSANKNYIGLWQSDDGIIPKGKAAWSKLIDKTDYESDLTLSGVPIKSDAYVLGYCQTGDPVTDSKAASNVSASAVIKAEDTNAAVVDKMTLNITGNSSTAKLQYTVLNNIDKSSHWIGIWIESSGITSDELMFSASVSESSRSSANEIDLRDAGFIRGETYVLAYFANGFEKRDVSNMVAQITFKI